MIDIFATHGKPGLGSLPTALHHALAAGRLRAGRRVCCSARRWRHARRCGADLKWRPFRGCVCTCCGSAVGTPSSSAARRAFLAGRVPGPGRRHSAPAHGALLFGHGLRRALLARRAPSPSASTAGSAPVRLPPEETLEAQLARLASRRATRGVLASHFHADHVAAARPPAAGGVVLGWRAGARARARTVELAAQGLPAGAPALRPRCAPPSDRGRSAPDVAGALMSPGEGHDLLHDGSPWAVPLPGHARGQVGLLCCGTRTSASLLLAADAAWSTRALLERKRPPFGPVRPRSTTGGAYLKTLDVLGALARAGDRASVLPSHSLEAWRALPRRACASPGAKAPAGQAPRASSAVASCNASARGRGSRDPRGRTPDPGGVPDYRSIADLSRPLHPGLPGRTSSSTPRPWPCPGARRTRAISATTSSLPSACSTSAAWRAGRGSSIVSSSSVFYRPARPARHHRGARRSVRASPMRYAATKVRPVRARASATKVRG